MSIKVLVRWVTGFFSSREHAQEQAIECQEDEIIKTIAIGGDEKYRVMVTLRLVSEFTKRQRILNLYFKSVPLKKVISVRAEVYQ